MAIIIAIKQYIQVFARGYLRRNWRPVAMICNIAQLKTFHEKHIVTDEQENKVLITVILNAARFLSLMFVPDQPSMECIGEACAVYAAVHNSVQRRVGCWRLRNSRYNGSMYLDAETKVACTVNWVERQVDQFADYTKGGWGGGLGWGGVGDVGGLRVGGGGHKHINWSQIAIISRHLKGNISISNILIYQKFWTV